MCTCIYDDFSASDVAPHYTWPSSVALFLTFSLYNFILCGIVHCAGPLQVQLALAYLSCCPGGISETELEDTLSIDDDFLSAVFQVNHLQHKF